MSHLVRASKVAIALLLALALSIPPAQASPELDPPILTSYVVTPSAVDVTRAAATITATVELSDATGVKPPSVAIGWDRAGGVGHYFDSPVAMALTSGTDTVGVWEATFTIPAGASAGVRTIRLDKVSDTLGNDVTFSSLIIGTVDVVNSPDVEAPAVGEVVVTPTTVDITEGPASVSMTVVLSDATGVVTPVARLTGPDSVSVPDQVMTLVAGTNTSGTWSTSFAIPAGSESGNWDLHVYGPSDILGNELRQGWTRLASLTVTSAPDEIDPPILTSYGVTPSKVDVTRAAATITATVELSDATGVKPPSVAMGWDKYGHGTDFDPPVVMTLKSGTTNNGVWHATFTVPAGAPQGIRTIRLNPVSDVGGNTVTFSSLIIGTVNVINAPDVIAPVVGASKTTPDTVDSALGAKELSAWVYLTDDSGVVAPVVDVYDPDGDYSISAAMTLVSGTNKAGTWAVTFSADAGLQPGAWSFWIESVQDVLGNEKEVWAELGSIRSLPSLPTSGKFGEHTGDAYADVYGVDRTGTLRLFKGGPSSVSAVVDYGATMTGVTYLVQIGDWNGDKRSDVLARRADHSLWIYTSTPSGGLVPWRQVGKNWGSMDKIVFAGSLNGSSHKYVVARQASTGDLYRYQITTSGLVGVSKIGQNWNGMKFFFSVGDFNGDGRGDIIGVRSSDGTMWFYPGRTDGKLDYGRQVGRGWGNFQHAFSPGDFSGDGRFDLLGVDSQGVLWGYHNTGSGWSFYEKMGTGYGGYVLLA